MPSSQLILCHPLLLPPSIFPGIRVFSNESALCTRWPKYWSFSFSINPSNEYSLLISFRMDWLDLLAVQGTLKSLVQHHSSEASIRQHSAFFMVQLSHPNMTTRKIIALTRGDFVSKVMSLIFNTLSRLVINFIPRSKCLLISWLRSPSTVILEPEKMKSVTASILSPSGRAAWCQISPHSWKTQRWGHSRVGPRVSVKEEFRQLSPQGGAVAEVSWHLMPVTEGPHWPHQTHLSGP